MKTKSLIQRRRLVNIAARLAGAASLALAGAPATAVTYVEGAGDLSSDPLHPSAVGMLGLGLNTIAGSSIPSGPIVDTSTGARAVEDNDYVSFTVAPGQVLTQLGLAAGSAFQPNDRMFFGIAQGTQVNVNPSFTSAAGLLGWTLVGNGQIGTDVLPALGQAAPPMFPAIPGATGFQGALGAGTYTLWMVDGDRPATYSFSLLVAAVPEPAAWITMILGVGLVGGVLRRQARPAASAIAAS